MVRSRVPGVESRERLKVVRHLVCQIVTTRVCHRGPLDRCRALRRVSACLEERLADVQYSKRAVFRPKIDTSTVRTWLQPLSSRPTPSVATCPTSPTTTSLTGSNRPTAKAPNRERTFCRKRSEPVVRPDVNSTHRSAASCGPSSSGFVDACVAPGAVPQMCTSRTCKERPGPDFPEGL